MWAPPLERVLLQWPWLGFPTTLRPSLPMLSITLLYTSTGHNLVRLTCVLNTHTQTHAVFQAKLFIQKGLKLTFVFHKDRRINTYCTLDRVCVSHTFMAVWLLPHSSPSLLMSFSALQDLQGEVESYFLTVESPQSSQILALAPEFTSTVISDLWPSTTYLVSLQVSNGAHNTTKAIVNITTEDGGMFISAGFLKLV